MSDDNKVIPFPSPDDELPPMVLTPVGQAIAKEIVRSMKAHEVTMEMMSAVLTKHSQEEWVLRPMGENFKDMDAFFSKIAELYKQDMV